ncbi:MAG: 50S ribosomal protein L21 [Acidimicrobiales bacterium]
MYAVINAGGKQERVAVGEQVDVELIDAEEGAEIKLTPLLLVDGADIVTEASALAGSTVSATVIGETKGPKITGFTYKSKSNQRRRYGHRQRYTTLEITGIDSARSTAKSKK